MLINYPLKVTKRDLSLLVDVYENNFLSFYQIHENHFKDLAKPTVYNRLAKLIKAEVLVATYVNLYAAHRNNELIGVVYRLGSFGIKIFTHYFSALAPKANQVTLNLSSMYHDLLLTDVLKVTKQRYPNCTIWNAKVYPDKLDVKEKIPDAIIFDPISKNKMALELELTLKSDIRYQDIILNYRVSNEFTKVIYIVANEALHKKIGGIITNRKGHFEISDSTDKFEFMALKDFINYQPKELLNEASN